MSLSDELDLPTLSDQTKHNAPDPEDVGEKGHFYPREQMSKMWSKYLMTSEKYDKEIVESWKGDADGILIFTGLFSATVAAFIIESYKGLLPDNSDTTVALLSQLVALSNGSQVPPFPPAFQPSSSSVRINVLWFLSLCMSLTCALGATLMQRWARSYLRFVQAPRSDSHAQALFRTWAFEGVLTFRFPEAVEAISALLHISLFLFFTGLIEFIFPIHRSIAFVVLGFIIAVAAVYFTLTVIPLGYRESPYHTPISNGLWRLASLAIKGVERFSSGCIVWPRRTSRFLRALRSSSYQESIETAARDASFHIALKAMKHALTSLQSSDDDEHFFEGLAAYVGIRGTKAFASLIHGNSDTVVDRITVLLCDTNTGLTELAMRQRVLTCARVIWQISYSHFGVHSIFTASPGLATYATVSRNIRRYFLELKRSTSDPRVAVVASCLLARAASAEAKSYMRNPGRNLRQLEVQRQNLAGLLDAPQDLADQVLSDHDMRCNATLVNLIGIVRNLLPHLQAKGPLGEKTFLWLQDLLYPLDPVLQTDVGPSNPSEKVRVAFWDLWNETKRLAGKPLVNVTHTGIVILDEYEVVRGRLTELVKYLRPVIDSLQERFYPGTLVVRAAGGSVSPRPGLEPLLASLRDLAGRESMGKRTVTDSVISMD